MIIGFLGKGGSGKSTCATLMTKFLHNTGSTVLAIDADHNMDLIYNLEIDTAKIKPIGGTFLPLRESLGISLEEKTDLIFTNQIPKKIFSLNPADKYTEEHAFKLKDNLFCMMSGPQNENVLYGSHCSHSLAAPLKIYLPLLDLKDNEFVVVDEKASVDAVSTGIPTGFDLAIICAEPKEHSIRVASQIKELLNWYDVPYKTILNKTKSISDIEFFEKSFGNKPDFIINIKEDTLDLDESNTKTLEKIKEYLIELKNKNISRLERTIKKYKRNLEMN